MTTGMKYAIEYRYPGTVNGEPVGIVYAENIDWSAGVMPIGHRDRWSYTKEPAGATLFDTEDDARSEASRHSWPNARVVEVAV